MVLSSWVHTQVRDLLSETCTVVPNDTREEPLAKPLYSIFPAGLAAGNPAAQFHAFLRAAKA